MTAVIIFVFNSIAFAQDLPPIDSKTWTTKYDEHFRKYSKRFFGVGFDWKWFKAQAIAESSLKDDAKSWAGAKGIMQIVPRTFAEIKGKNPSFADINEPRWNIAAGIYYDNQQYRRWTDISTQDDKLSFMFASYNAGRGTILNAQRVSKQEGYQGITWDHIEAVAIKVPRWRHDETLGYIKKIFKLMNKTEK
ncbi:transglycosylase SLT domain-containing protein [candidate division KSB1 bacterium]|nr:transglycosylase SLT domain-containing protein [candidate division KSB1 bacterium]